MGNLFFLQKVEKELQTEQQNEMKNNKNLLLTNVFARLLLGQHHLERRPARQREPDARPGVVSGSRDLFQDRNVEEGIHPAEADELVRLPENVHSRHN